jgi:hypothetical protein
VFLKKFLPIQAAALRLHLATVHDPAFDLSTRRNPTR